MSFNQEVADYIERITAKAQERYDEERNKVDGLVDSVFRSGDDAPEPAFDQIAPKLGRFAHGHPASCEHMVEKLELAADALRRNLDDEIADVRIKLEGWQGPAAIEFAEYLGDFEAAAMTQVEYIEAMRVLADAQRQVLENTRTDFLTIAGRTMEALETPVESEGFSVADALIITGAVLMMLAPIPAGAPTAAALLVSLTTVASSARTIANETTEARVQGTYTAEMLDSAFESFDRLRDRVIEQEELVRQGLGALSDQVNRTPIESLEPRRPSIADDDRNRSNPDDFRLPATVTT